MTHSSDACDGTERCVNCDGGHAANSKDCPKWKIEKEVQRVKLEKNISIPEARIIVEMHAPPIPGLSYANAASPDIARKPQTKTTETQTPITWLNAPNYKPITTHSSPSSQFSQTSTPRGRSPKASTPKPASPERLRQRQNTQKPAPPEKHRQRETPKERIQLNSSKPANGSDDPVKLHNTFETLADM